MDMLSWGARGAEAPEGRKIFRKCVEIFNVKFINFAKIERISCTELGKNIRIIENIIRPGGSGGGGGAPRR